MMIGTAHKERRTKARSVCHLLGVGKSCRFCCQCRHWSKRGSPLRTIQCSSTPRLYIRGLTWENGDTIKPTPHAPRIASPASPASQHGHTPPARTAALSRRQTSHTALTEGVRPTTGASPALPRSQNTLRKLYRHTRTDGLPLQETHRRRV